MIRGIGTDIVQVDRIKNAIDRTPNFMKKVFTDKEIEYFKSRKNNIESISGSFAAKEAISKALGTGVRKFGLLDIEILRNDLGKPIAKISRKIIEELGIEYSFLIHVSISHTKENAIAFAVLEEIT